MSYTKTNWQNLPSTSTPVVANSLNKMENGIADANGAIAVNTYSSSSTYAIGDYCMYNNKLYRCKTAIATAEAFNSSKWQQIKIMEEMANTGATVSPTEPTGNNKNKVWVKKGKNLFDRNSATFGYFNAASGQLTTGDANWKYCWIKVEPSTAYVVSGVTTTQSSIGIAEFNANGGVVPNSGFNYHNGTFTTKATTAYLGACCRIGEVNTFQIEQGTTATAYEAYVEPQIYIKNNNNVYEEFNQDEVFVSSNEPAGSNAKVWFKKGKNLFNAYKYSYITRDNNETYQINGANSISVSGTNKTWSRIQFIISDLNPNTSYTISSTITNTSQHNAALIVTIGTTEKNSTTTESNKRLNVSFTTDSTGNATIGLFSNWSGTNLSETIIYNNLQLEQGVTVTDYEAYVEPKIYTKNNNSVYEEFEMPQITRKTYTITIEDNVNVAPFGSYGSINIPAEEVSRYGEIVSVYSINNAGAPMPCGYIKQSGGNYSIRLVSNTTHKNMTVRVVFSKEKMNIIT